MPTTSTPTTGWLVPVAIAAVMAIGVVLIFVLPDLLPPVTAYP